MTISKQKQIIDIDLYNININKTGVNLLKEEFIIKDEIRAHCGAFWNKGVNVLPIINSNLHKKSYTIELLSTTTNKDNNSMFNGTLDVIKLTPEKKVFSINSAGTIEKVNVFNEKTFADTLKKGFTKKTGNDNLFKPQASISETSNNINSLTFNTVQQGFQPSNFVSSGDTIVKTNNVEQKNLSFSEKSLTEAQIEINKELNLFNNITESEVFFDHTTLLEVPFTKNDLRLQKNVLSKTSIIEFTPKYNFFIDEYEKILNKVPEKLLPNLYSFCSELESENSDSKNTIFKKHINLFDTIPDFFIDITNRKGEKIGEKDKGQYFEEYSRRIIPFLNDNIHRNELEFKFSTLIVPFSNMEILNKYNDKEVMFPMSIGINFSTDNSTEICQSLNDSGLMSLLIRNIHDKVLKSKTISFQETETLLKEDKKQIKTSAKTEKKDINVWNLEEWIKIISSTLNDNVNELNELFNGVYIGKNNDEIELSFNKQYELYKNISILVFVNKLQQIITNHLRTYDKLIDGKLAYSENLFYRIEKIDQETGNVIQNVYIPNSNSIEMAKFIDSQVKYNKNYKYNIFVYQAVIGNSYSYKLKEFKDDLATIEVKNNPSVKILELLLSEFEGKIMDDPPMPPDIDIIPYKGINNKLLMNFNSGIGFNRTDPITIEETDNILFNELRKAKQLEQNEPIEFHSDDLSSFFEIFRTTDKPKSYLDFKGKRIKRISTDISSLSLQAANAASIIENIIPNKKYYYTFRAIDVHGHVSNPSPVYQVELVDNSNSVYPVIEVIDFDDDNKEYNINFKKFMQLIPAFNQKVINEEKSGLLNENGERIESALGKDNIHLGIEQEQVWNKKFKIRITSNKTGKKIDLNIRFVHNHFKT